MAIDLGTLYTTIEAQVKGYKEAEQSSDKLAKTMLRQADAVQKAEIEFERLKTQLKGTAGSEKYINQASEALNTFKRRAETAGKSSVLFSAAQKDFKNSIAQTKTGLMGAGVATTGWQTRMQELTKSVQLALGPLSGVASRITALTALFNRSTLIWAGLFAGITAISVGMYKAVVAGNLYESSMAKITHQLELTGHASGQTTETIDKMTKALALNTLASVSGAREAATAILTFTSITGENVERTLGLAQDLTDSLGGDLPANAKKLGKIIEDPSKAFETLNEMGARLSETERSRLSVMAATGEHLQAQEFVLAKIESRVKGIGKAGATGTLAGAYDTLVESITFWFEALSKNSGLLASFKEAINTISTAIQRWTKVVEEGYKPLEVLGSTIGSTVKGIAWMISNIHLLVGALASFVIVRTVIGLWKAYTTASTAATVATNIFSGAIKRIPFVAIASLLAGGVAMWMAYGDAAEETSESVAKVTESNKKFLKSQKDIQMDDLSHRIAETTAQLELYESRASSAGKIVGMLANRGDFSSKMFKRNKKIVEGNNTAIKELGYQLEQLQKRYNDLDKGVVENTKSTQGQIDAVTRLIATYFPAAAAVRKFREDQEILDTALGKTGTKQLTLNRYLASFGDVTKMTSARIKELSADYHDWISTAATASSMAALSSPFQKAKDDVENLIKAQRSASQAAGKGAGLALSFSLSSDETAIQREVNKLRAGFDSDPKKIIKMNLRLNDGSLVQSADDAEKFVRETMKKTQQLTQASLFTKMLSDTEDKFNALNKATISNPFGALFNTEVYQRAVAFNSKVKQISDQLAAKDIANSPEVFKSLARQVEGVAKTKGLGELVPPNSIKNVDQLAEGLARVTEETKKTPLSIQAIMSTVSTIMSGIESVLGQVTSAYGEMAAAAGAAAKEAIERGMSQSQFYMELADTVHYSNNVQAKSFEDKAIAAAEAGAREYHAQKEAQAKANNLAKKAFENQKQMQIAQAMMSTATAVMQTYTNSGLGIFAAPLAVAMGALGAAQISAISSQQYTPRERGGPITGGKPYLVGEKGPELMIPGKGGTMIPNKKLDGFGGGGDVNVTFQITANDTEGFDQLLANRKGLIMNMMREATDSQMRNSPV